MTDLEKGPGDGSPQRPPSGVTIPGYQPVEKVGGAPSFGILLRAVQTRMDRHVLLKLLPQGAPGLEAFFAREIAAQVRLGGKGALPVIDEGTVDHVRFLVSDEAASESLVERRVSGDEIHALARDIESLFRRVGEMDLVLLPIPPVAIRRLPSGDFATSDLGWLVPVGEKIPELPSLPENARGVPAAPWMNARFLGITLSNVANAVADRVPREWRRLVSELESATADDDLLSEQRFNTPQGNGHHHVPLPVLIVLGILIIAAAGYAATQFIIPAPEDPGPRVVENDDDGGDPEPPPPVDRGKTPDQILDEQAQEILHAILEVSDEPGIDDVAALSSWVHGHVHDDQRELFDPVSGVKKHQLEKMAARFGSESEYGATPSGVAARRIRERIREREEERLWAIWKLSFDRVNTHLEKKEFQLAESEMNLLRPELHPRHERRFHELEHRLERMDRAEYRRVLQDAEANLEAADFASALSTIQRALSTFTSATREKAEKMAEDVTREEQYLAAYLEALDAAVVASRSGTWDEPRKILEGALPEARFTRIIARVQIWLDLLSRAEKVSESMLGTLRGRVEGDISSYTIDGKPVRGLVRSVGSRDFVLKHHGRTTTATVDLLELSPENRQELAREGGHTFSRMDWLLLDLFLGDVGQALRALMQELDDEDKAKAAIAKFRARWMLQRLTALLEDGRVAHAAGDWAKAREAGLTIQKEYPTAQIKRFENERRAWYEGYWKQDPLLAFPGADSGSVEFLTTDRLVVRVVDLTYENFDWATQKDWVLVGGAADAPRVIQGSLRLRPEGRPGPDMVFEEELDVEVRMASWGRPGGGDYWPNLNVVLWSSGTKKNRRGLLFGLGWRSNRVASIGTKFFPANVIAELPQAEGGQNDASIIEYEGEKRFGRGNEYTFRGISSGSKPSRLESQKLTLQAKDHIYGQRTGSVDICTYQCKARLTRITINGRLNASWWKNWVLRKVRKDLGG